MTDQWINPKHIQNAANIVAHAIYDDKGNFQPCIFCEYANDGKHTTDCPAGECLAHAEKHDYLDVLMDAIRDIEAVRSHHEMADDPHDAMLWADWKGRWEDDN